MILYFVTALPAPNATKEPIFVHKHLQFVGSADWSSIVGGSDASSGQFPYMASLRAYNAHICDAAIVSSRYLLSAAHCTIG